MVYSFINGNKVYFNKKKQAWYYLSDKTEATNINLKPCIKCNEYQTNNNHDFCIRNLKGVISACCGHGIENSYILFYYPFNYKKFNTREELFSYLKSFKFKIRSNFSEIIKKIKNANTK